MALLRPTTTNNRRPILKTTSMADSSGNNSSQSWTDFHRRYHSQSFHCSAKNEGFMRRHPDGYMQGRSSRCESSQQQIVANQMASERSSRSPTKKQTKGWFLFGICQRY